MYLLDFSLHSLLFYCLFFDGSLLLFHEHIAEKKPLVMNVFRVKSKQDRLFVKRLFFLFIFFIDNHETIRGKMIEKKAFFLLS